jgi:hypothetical protein
VFILVDDYAPIRINQVSNLVCWIAMTTLLVLELDLWSPIFSPCPGALPRMVRRYVNILHSPLWWNLLRVVSAD